MSILKVSFFLFLISPPFSAQNDHCRTSMCAQNPSPIRFPFRLQPQQPQNCGYLGFNLFCNSVGNTVLNIPFSGDFLVRSINYRAKLIQIYDPHNCLPRRIFDFNLSGSPFAAAYYQNYTFLTCPAGLDRSRLTAVDCLSNSTNTTLATPSATVAAAMGACEIVATLMVPVSSPVEYENGFFSDLGDDLVLTWGVPDCEECELNGRACGFKNSSSPEISCLDNPGTGTPRGLNIFRIIALSIAIPAITCSFAIAFIMCFMYRRRRRSRHGSFNAAAAPQNFSSAATVMPEITTATPGLDEPTIESYSKVVVGESRRIQGPNHVTCPICLSDYHPKDTLRSIPECQHCFHSECVDEWLRMKGTCPVCRNSPSSANVNS